MKNKAIHQDLPEVPRIAILGTSGSGKSTLGCRLSELLDIPFVELDAIRHGPNWAETPNHIFRQRVSCALQSDGWVVAGNYTFARDIIWESATTLIWLDYSFPLVFWRLFWRTIARGVLRKTLWNGNRESLWRHFITKDSLFLWAIQSHWKRRKTLPPAFALPQHSHLQILHFRSARSADRWLANVSSSLSRPHMPPSGASDHRTHTN